jgi:cyanate permease
LASNPKKTIISIIGLIIALGIYLIFFAMGTSDTSDSLLLKNPVDKSTVVTTTAGLFTVLLGLGIGVIVILAGPLMGRFRK